MPIGSGGRRQPPKFKDLGKSAGKATIKGKDVARAVSKRVKKSKKAKSSSNAPVISVNSWELRLTDKDSRIKQLVRKASVNLLRDKFAEILGYAVADFSDAAKEEIAAELEGVDVLNSLLNEDKIASELGITDEVLIKFESNLDKLFQLRIDQKLSNSSINDRMPTASFEIIPFPKEEDLMDTSIGFAYYTEKGELKRWLAQLLYGEEDYNPGYQVIDAKGFGRTNLKIMVKTDGKEYELDSSVRGSKYSNWIRDTIQEMIGDLQLIYKKILQSHIQEEIKFKKNIRSR